MATCKDCIHYDICTFNLTGKENEKCLHFLDKADVVEVVRCKDCKHATFYACKNNACYREIICEYRIGTDDENFFCIYGERRER